jgi:hypothetical protein
MKTRREFLGVLATGALTGCGYALVGRGMVVDPDIKKIGVPTFSNSSSKPGLELKITHGVIEELLKRGRFDVVSESSGVNAVVSGELVSYRASPVGFSDTGAIAASGKDSGAPTTQASRYEISVTAKVKYTKTGADEPIWSNEGFVFKDEYDLGSDPSTFLDRESQALDRLAESFARTLVSNMLEAF